MPGRDSSASTLLLDEYFDTEDERFLFEVLNCRVREKLKSLAEPWYRDGRPFAREALLAYVDDGCDRPGHRPLVKGLFKLAEASRDDELMARFLVVFDRFARRVLVQGTRWNRADNTFVPYYALRTDRNVPGSLAVAGREGRFSIATRRYLARRAFRYFRRMGYRDTARYGRAIRQALERYEDATLDTPVRLLDAWGLMHALYGRSPALVHDSRGLRVGDGHQLADLEPAPLHPTAWRGCFDDVMHLARSAQSRTVRQWAAKLLEKAYARELEALSVTDVVLLLASPHEEVQAFGAGLLARARDVDRLSVRDWLELLRIENLTILPLVCELAERHLAPARLSLEECVALANARLAPVAELGLRWTRERGITNDGELTQVLELRDAAVPDVRAEAARWLADLLRTSPLARPEHVRDFVDSRHADVRAAGLALLHSGSRFARDLDLAAALSESPYDDVRAWLVARLAEWEREVEPGTLLHVWTTAMLAVHRGNRVKIAVLDQISNRLAARPDEASVLLPIVAVALRSVRQAERRSALAALARAAFRVPALAAEISRFVPELRLEAVR